jgi:hypothetical protein
MLSIEKVAGDLIQLARDRALDDAARILLDAAIKLRGTSKRINQFDNHTVYTLNEFAEKILALKSKADD